MYTQLKNMKKILSSDAQQSKYIIHICIILISLSQPQQNNHLFKHGLALRMLKIVKYSTIMPQHSPLFQSKSTAQQSNITKLYVIVEATENDHYKIITCQYPACRSMFEATALVYPPGL